MARPGFGGQPSAADSYRVGRRIRVPEVRVIGADGGQVGIMPTHEALRMAEESGLELVEVNPRAAPPVCRIMDFGKFKYETSKKEKESRKHQSTVVVKEVKLRPKTDDHDFDFKVKHIRRFLSEGNKCRLVIVFRGREIVHPETGQAMLDAVVKAVTDLATVEQRPSMEGRRMVMTIGPKAGVIRPVGPGAPATGAGSGPSPSQVAMREGAPVTPRFPAGADLSVADMGDGAPLPVSPAAASPRPLPPREPGPPAAPASEAAAAAPPSQPIGPPVSPRAPAPPSGAASAKKA